MNSYSSNQSSKRSSSVRECVGAEPKLMKPHHGDEDGQDALDTPMFIVVIEITSIKSKKRLWL